MPIDVVNNNLPWRSGPSDPAGLQNDLIADPIYQFYPFLVGQVQAVRSGYWPLWSTHILLGHPLLGDPLAQTFYPVFLGLGLILGPARGLTVGFWLHALLAAGLTYAWLRSAGIGQAGAVAGSLAYALGGFMVTALETPFWVSSLAWLPGVLWMYERAVQRKSLRDATWAGLMLGAAGLGGQLSLVVTFCGFLSLYSVGHLVQAARRWRRLEAGPVVCLGLTFGIGGLVAAIQVLPFVEALSQSHRAGGVGFGTAPWRQIVTWLVPNFFGNPSTTRVYWGGLNYFEGVVYAGVVFLYLAVLAPFAARRFWPIYLFCLGAAILYFGYGGPGTRLFAVVPLTNYIALSQALFLMPLVIGYLAGTTLDVALGLKFTTFLAAAASMGLVVVWAWLGNWNDVQAHAAQVRLALLWAGAMLAGAGLLLLLRGAMPRWQTWFTWLLVALGFADLFAIGSRFNAALPIASLPQATPAIVYLQQQPLLYRVATVQRPPEIIFGPNYLSVFGLRDLSGYSSLLPRALTRLVAAGDPASGGYSSNTIWLAKPSQRLLDLLGAGFVVSRDPGPGARLNGDNWQQVYRGELNISERVARLPRAYVVYAAETIGAERAAIGRVLDESFDLRNIAVVDQELPLASRSALAATPAELVSYADQDVLLRVTAAEAGLLVLGDQPYPGWKAWVDGRPAPVVTANVVWRGVLIPPGEHQVEFKFDPVSVKVGLLLTTVGLILAAAFWRVANYRQARNAARQQP